MSSLTLAERLEKAAEIAIDTGARFTISGNFAINESDMPPDVLSQREFKRHITEIAGIVSEYAAVADVEVTPDGIIDLTYYLDYCPNYEPDADRREDYPDDRKILDPLKTRRPLIISAVETPDKPVKPTLAERLKEGKRKAALHVKPDNKHKLSKQEAR